MPEYDLAVLAQNWDTFSQSPLFYPILFALLAVLIVFWVIIRKNRSRVRLFKNEAGYVTASKSAIVDLVQSLCANEGLTPLPSVYIKRSGDQLNLKVKIQAPINSNTQELTSRLQNSIISTLKDKLGIQHLNKVHIYVSRFNIPKNHPLEQNSDED